MAEDSARQKTAIQTYDLAPETDRSELAPTPAGEHLGEVDTETFEFMLAQHLTDEALERIVAMRGRV